jgi:hypothetical protein
VTPTGGAEGSGLTTHLIGLHNAVKMLNARVKTLHSFCAASNDGKIPVDHGILRQIASLCNVLPAMDTGVFSEDFIKVRGRRDRADGSETQGGRGRKEGRWREKTRGAKCVKERT